MGMKVIGESLRCKSAEGISNFVFSFKTKDRHTSGWLHSTVFNGPKDHELAL